LDRVTRKGKTRGGIAGGLKRGCQEGKKVRKRKKTPKVKRITYKKNLKDPSKQAEDTGGPKKKGGGKKVKGSNGQRKSGNRHVPSRSLLTIHAEREKVNRQKKVRQIEREHPGGIEKNKETGLLRRRREKERHGKKKSGEGKDSDFWHQSHGVTED